MESYLLDRILPPEELAKLLLESCCPEKAASIARELMHDYKGTARIYWTEVVYFIERT